MISKRKLQILDEDESEGSKEFREIAALPPPPQMLGADLKTLDDASQWLLHPTNWVESTSQIVYWTGVIPKLSSFHALRLMDNPQDRPSLFASIIREQWDLKHPKKEDLSPERAS
jgi:hypothetical protein